MDTSLSFLEQRLRLASPDLQLTPQQHATLRAAILGDSPLPMQIGRYILTSYLGGGASGRVYKVYDHVKQQRVALKVLHESGPASEQLLKREFRALLNISHRNLITFFEAHVVSGLCYMTMELVEGEEFTRWVSSESSSSQQAESAGRYLRCDLSRLRSALQQLASGVGALHDAGLVHRDLKPSNVLVTDSSRLVVLDFGLSRNPRSSPLHSTFSGRIVGTPAYMAPEQFLGQPAEPASDCYAIGLMLFEALVGEVPHTRGSSEDIAKLRTTSAPVRAGEFVTGVPRDLDDLCYALLHPDPKERPTCRDILEQLSKSGEATAIAHLNELPKSEGRFIGRTAELKALHAALAGCSRRCLVFALGGPAGSGKSSLVKRFVSELSPDEHVVLATRCHEREMFPYKTIDALLDALVPYLKTLSPRALDGVLPRHIAELVNLFPSLARVQGFAEVGRASRTSDEHEQMQRAISAMRELLGRIADRCTLVLWVDDLQWGDCDSVGIIRQLVCSSDAPHCLCIGTFRTETAAVHQLAERFFGRRRSPGMPLDVVARCLRPLSESETVTLARELMEHASDETILQAARESAGSPSLLSQLADLALDRATDEYTPVTLQELWHSRRCRLSPSAAHVVQLVALAASSVEHSVIIKAAQLSDHTVIHELRTARLVSSEGAPDRVRIGLYDQRLAAPILSELEASRSNALHLKLAEAFIACDVINHERIAFHLEKAGRCDDAREWLLKGAARASDLFAHTRAARLYSLALRFPLEPTGAQTIRTAWAHALRASGRRLEAAHAFAQTSANEPDYWRRLELLCWAAQDFLLTEHIETGRGLVHQIMTTLRLSLPRGTWRAQAIVATRRALFNPQGRNPRRRADREITRSDLARVDACWMLGHVLALTDPLLASLVQVHHARLALKCGEPERIARAVALEAVCACYAGPSARPRVRQLLRTARQLSAGLADSRLRVTTALCDAMTACFLGETERALREVDVAERILREECSGTAYEVEICHLIALIAYNIQAAWAPFRARTQDLLNATGARGDGHRLAVVRLHASLASLLAGDIEGAQKTVQEMAQARWARDFQIQHLAWLLGETRLHVYQGDGIRAVAHIEGMWRQAQRSGLLKAPLVMVESLAWRARAHALAYSQTRDPRHRRAALKSADALERQHFVGAVGHALLVRGSVALAAGEKASAVDQWRSAAAQYEHDHLWFFAAIARYQSARHEAGAEAERVAEQSRRVISDSGVASLSAALRLFVGMGFSDG